MERSDHFSQSLLGTPGHKVALGLPTRCRSAVGPMRGRRSEINQKMAAPSSDFGHILSIPPMSDMNASAQIGPKTQHVAQLRALAAPC